MIFFAKTKIKPNQAKRQRVLSDPKFLTGLALIVLSIVLTSVIVARAKGGATYYEITADIAAGQEISTSELKAVSARIESDAYIPAGELPENLIAIRSLSKGELLPKTAIITENDLGRRQLVIKVSPAIPSSVKVGSEVEVWAVPQKQLNDKGTKEAKVLTNQALIVALPQEQSRLLNDRTQAVEISVPAAQLAVLLESTNSDYQLVIVPKG